MKKGDHIYYYTEKFGHLPCKILRVTKKRLKICDGIEKPRFVKAENCILQTDWLKEHA